MTPAAQAVIEAAIEWKKINSGDDIVSMDEAIYAADQLTKAVNAYQQDAQSATPRTTLLDTVKAWATDMGTTDAMLVEAWNAYEKEQQR